MANRPVFLDENLFFMEKALKEGGHNIQKVPRSISDIAIRKTVEQAGGILVTRNYKHFKQMRGVVRVGDKDVSLLQQIITTRNSLEAARLNPEIFLRMNHIPASGLNIGLLKAPQCPGK